MSLTCDLPVFRVFEDAPNWELKKPGSTILPNRVKQT